jgi:hypothetical protein
VTRGPRRKRAALTWLLVLPLLALAFPALYAHEEPALWGLPFFYWYQGACLIASAALTWVVYAATR